MTTLTHNESFSGSRSRTPICVVGSAAGFTDLLDALQQHEDVEVIHSATFLADATTALEDGGIEAVLYVTHAGPDWLEELTAIREHTSAPIVLLSSNQSGAVLDQALDAGVAEAMLLPQGVENVAFALRRARERDAGTGAAETSEGRVVTVFSPKGGIGKSIVATNLATMLAGEEKRRTLLIDLDLQFGDAAIVMGLQPEETLHDLISAPGGLDPEKLAGYTTRHESGVEVLPAPLRPQDANLVTDAKLARLFEVALMTYDEIVVDTAPFLHGPILTALDHSSDLVLICSPEVPALKDVGLSLTTLRLLGFPKQKIRLVLNHAHANGGLKHADIEATLGLTATVAIPHDPIVSEAVNRGIPAVRVNPKTDFAQAFRTLSAAIHGGMSGARSRKSGLLWRSRA
jgi:pilus assembly protein CpaE